MLRFFTGMLILAALLAGCTTPKSATLAPTPASATTLPATYSKNVEPTAAQPTDNQPSAVQTGVTQVVSSPADCTSPASLTPVLTEGPFFKANSPERTSLLDSGMSGTKLILTGYVLTADCQPVAHALLDFWQADAQGQYDNAGYNLRGHQYTDANGRYQLETVVPGLYTGRTEHIHVKVQAPDGPVLTTQLFFPGVTENDTDTIYNPALLINIQENSDSMQGMFNFIVAAQ